MKIRDLDKGRYIVVYDMGKSEYSEGMAIVGKVVELEYNEDGKNTATIESIPFQRYTVTDDNYFDYWNDYMENKTEYIGIKRQSNDLEQRKRKEENIALFKIKDLKVGYRVKVLGENMTGEVSKIADNGKSAEIKADYGVYRVINDNYDFTIIEWNTTPQYAEDMVNSPSHYMLGKHEVKDIVSLVADKYHKGSVAHNIASALEYQMRAPEKNGIEDIKKARKCLDFAVENWDVK
ncbi:DUF3310 domain-containing protein [Staphylococcus arlettae]|uniref:DUF3310 domain-containing protein n=1 Tax=Staphylococcus arlettae TaxID=29378 RepID=UPI000D1A9B74|nr:DUF3310 domain-containing protein [Staphylococcus arlettae]PTH60464.1 hypothetical protein BU599_05040 [Staphylococcus arlettae]RIM70580.1 DUF3310 domain-containing protein [Staphylococcus arlettae]RIM74661.1 DUF3310 domain-containing protein [Staphylococcus arlettae]